MENKNYRVYKITAPDGMVYIGYSGEKRIKDRWRKHIHQHTSLEPYIEKYGYDNLLKEVVKDGLNKQEAVELEGILIDKYKEEGVCINKMGSGGEEMLKKRIKERHSRWCEEHKEEIRNKGKVWREENKEYKKSKDREYYLKNKERVLEKARFYREKNKEKLNEQCRLWKQRKKEDKQLKEKGYIPLF